MVETCYIIPSYINNNVMLWWLSRENYSMESPIISVVGGWRVWLRAARGRHQPSVTANISSAGDEESGNSDNPPMMMVQRLQAWEVSRPTTHGSHVQLTMRRVELSSMLSYLTWTVPVSSHGVGGNSWVPWCGKNLLTKDEIHINSAYYYYCGHTYQKTVTGLFFSYGQNMKEMF